MAAITDLATNKPAKILHIGKSGVGKTGAEAALICGGYKLRKLDTDKGFPILWALLTDERYPYAKIIKEREIDLSTAVDIVPIDVGMAFRDITIETKDYNGKIQRHTERTLAPTDSNAWEQAMNTLQDWPKYGPVTSWGPDIVLSIDTLATLAKMCYYWIQHLNNRLGARDEGFNYQRDIGGAQSQLVRFLEYLSDSSVKCNVIIVSHVNWIDDSRHYNQSPEQMIRDNKLPNPDGYPDAIGRAVSTRIGKYFNDQYHTKIEGNRRKIYTVPTDGVSAKKSVWLQESYNIETGLLEIFSAHRGLQPDAELLNSLAVKSQAATGGLNPAQLAAAKLAEAKTNGGNKTT